MIQISFFPGYSPNRQILPYEASINLLPPLDVRVYYNEGKSEEITELYQLNSVYLSRSKDDILIELPIRIKANGTETKLCNIQATARGKNQGTEEGI
jgi:hypothetical protein